MKTPYFSQDGYQHAWNFASRAHKQQHLPGSDIPYLNHIGNVAMEVIAAITTNPVNRPNLAIQCALLHDTIEDTDTSYDEIKSEFGEQVADGVLSLTKDRNLPTKKEQMADSLRRISQQPQEVWIVKLADRITNLQHPPQFWSQDKIKNYHSEANLIHQSLHKAHELLANRLRSKIEAYVTHFN